MVHRCLLIPELIRLICELASSNSMLSALARTCRAMQHPVLDVLWSELHNLVPLIKCFPSDLVHEMSFPGELGALMYMSMSGAGPSKTLFFARAMIPSDWNRFIEYAPRVRKLGFFQGTDEEHQSNIFTPRTSVIDVTVFHALTLSTNARKLLPNLRELCWEQNDDIFPFVHLFLSPKLTRLEISLNGRSITQATVVPLLVDLYPEIVHVDLFGYDFRGPELLKAVSTAVCRWWHLQILSVTDVSDDALMHIAQMPKLRRLSFHRLHYAKRMYTDVPVVPNHGFPALHKLELSTSKIENCVGLMQLMASSPLQELELTTQDDSPAIHWQELFMTLRRHCLRYTLSCVYIEAMPEEERPPINEINVDEHILEFAHIEPLLHFSNLVQIIVRPYYGFYLTQYATLTMAKTWRHVRRITLGTKTQSRRPPGITIKDLVPFAKYCRRLHTLGVVFDGRSVPKDSGKPGRGARCQSVRRLHVGDSQISDPPLVAAFLSDIFPRVNCIDTFDADADPDSMSEIPERTVHKEWAEVVRLIEVFASVRIQEQSSLRACDTSSEDAEEGVSMDAAEVVDLSMQ